MDNSIERNTRVIDGHLDQTPIDPKIEEAKARKSLIANYAIKISLLVLTLLCFTRVPFVGSYIDGLIDYLLGLAKYIFYPVMIFILISLIFHLPTEKVIKSPKFILLFLLSLLMISCMVSGINDLVLYFKEPPKFKPLMDNYHDIWVEYFKNWRYSIPEGSKYHFVSFVNYATLENGSHYVSGGILAVLISYVFNFLSYIVLFIISLVILVIAVFAIFNVNYRSTKIGIKIRGWMIKKLGGTFKYDGFDELRNTRANQNRFKKTSKKQIIKNAKTSDTISFDLLPFSDVSHFNENFKKAKAAQIKIDNLFKDNLVNAKPANVSVYTTYTEISFNVSNKQDIEKIINLQEKISSVLKIDNFNINVRELLVCIEYTNSYFSKVSLRSASMLFERKTDFTAFFGLDKLNKLVTQDFKTSPSALIIGKKGSGAATLSVLMALTMCYCNKPSDMDIVVLNPNAEATYIGFNHLPHSLGKSYEDIVNCQAKLASVKKELDERINKFNTEHIENIDKYVLSGAKMKRILLVISNFPNLIKDSIEASKIISEILQYGQKVGIYTILQSYDAGNETLESTIYKEASEKYIFELATETESMKIFNNLRGVQLHSNGDCLTFSKLTRFMNRIQICNINQQELNQDIDIIKTFYAVKAEMENNHGK